MPRIEIRSYRPSDRDRLGEIHDAARKMKVSDCVVHVPVTGALS